MAKNKINEKLYSKYFEYFKSILKKHPNYADIRNMAGMFYYLDGKYKSALKQFDLALQINPKYEEAFINKCFSLFDKGEKEISLNLMRTASRGFGKKSYLINLCLSILLAKNKDYSEALKYAIKSERINNNDSFSFVIQGICHYEKNNPQKAKQMFSIANKKVIKFNLDEIGIDGMVFPKTLTSIDELRSYYLKNPFICDFYIRIAEELDKTGNKKDLKYIMKMAISKCVPTSRMLYFLGLKALKNKKEDIAVKLLKKSFEINRNNAYPMILLFFMYGAKNNFRKAQNALNIALSHNPGYADLNNYKGLFLLDMDKPEESIKFFRKALRVNPYYVDALYNISQAYEQCGKYRDALKYYL